MEKSELNVHLIDEIQLFNQQINHHETHILQRYQLTLPLYKLALVVKEQPVTLNTLVTQTQTEKSTLSRQVATLVQKKWVTKTQTADKRVYLIDLTSFGLQSLTQVEQELQQIWTTVFKTWPEEEQQLLTILLGRLNRHFQSSQERN